MMEMDDLSHLDRTESSASLLAPPPDLHHSLNSRLLENGRADTFDRASTSNRTSCRPLSSAGSVPVQQILWRPLSLHRRIMVIYLLLSLAILAATEVLFQVSQRRHGLAQINQKDHYLWTYGPTLVLTIFGALWARLEYRSKQLAPWINVQRTQSWSQSNLFTEYVSLWQPVAIFKSFQNGDYLVTSASCGSLLFTLLIVVSTGLLHLETVVVPVNNVSIITTDSFVNSRAGLTQLGTMPAYTVQGIQYLNLSHPVGTTDKYAYQSLNTSNYPHGTVVEAVVDGWSSVLDCEEGHLNITSWTYLAVTNSETGTTEIQQLLAGPSLSTNTCQINYIDVKFAVGDTNTTQSYTLFGTGRCSNSTSIDEQRIVLLAGKVMISNETNIDCPWTMNEGNFFLSCSSYIYTVINSTQLICLPKYEISSLNLKMNSTTMEAAELTPRSPSSSTTLSQVHAWDIAQAFIDIFEHVQPWTAPSGVSKLRSSAGLYGAAMAMIFDKYSSLTFSDLLNSTVLSNICSDLFQRTGAQIVKNALFSNSSLPIDANLHISEDRLLVGLLSVRLIETLCAILACLGMVMILVTPIQGIVGQDPDSVIGMAAVVKNNPNLVSFFQGSGYDSLAVMRQKNPVLYLPATIYHNQVEMAYSKARIPRKKLSKSYEGQVPDSVVHKWYRPIVVKLAIISFACIIIVATIVALEVSLTFSKRNDGLGSASGNAYMHYLWSYLPALLMVGITTYFTSLDFEAKVIEPYACLRDGEGAISEFSVLHLSKMPVSSIWTAVRSRNWRILSTTLGMSFASFLAITVSGVFSTHTIVSSSDITVHRSGWFNTSVDNATSVACLQDVGITTGLVLGGNMTFPKWTYDTLALPTLELPVSLSAQNNESSTVNVATPAVRSTFDCHLYRDNITVEVEPTSGTWTIDIKTPDCLTTWPFSHQAGIFGFYTFSSCGSAWDLALWGTRSEDNLTKVTAMACDEQYQKLNVNATFSMPNFILDPSHPPIPDELTAQSAPELTENIFFTWSSPESDYLPNITSSAPLLDGYFDLMVYGTDGIPLSYLSDDDHEQDVVDAFKHVMGVARAQQYGLCAREDAVQASNMTLQGTATTSSQLWVVQNATSTRVLQTVLGAVLLCGIAAGVLLKTKKVLPNNPCSIAAKVSLLADSSLVRGGNKIIPSDVQWMSNDELRKSQLLDGYKFRMGWFDGTPTERGRFTIDAVDVVMPRQRMSKSASVVSTEQNSLLGGHASHAD